MTALATRAVPSPHTDAPVPHAAIIVGAGFIGMGIALRKRATDDFVILEKSHDAHGVWRDNTYPELACDVPSHLYSFSFEPTPDWSHAFAGSLSPYRFTHLPDARGSDAH